MTRFTVSLEPFGCSQVSTLAAWLRRPHVARWYPASDDNIAWATNPPQGGSQALIVCNARPVGYIRWQIVDRETLDAVGLHNVPSNSVDVDLLLGELEHVGKGVGPAALELLVGRLRTDPTLPPVGLTSSVENVRAHRAFEKSGFHVAQQYTPAGFGQCYLFVRTLRPARHA
jgi:aminoglycoside 6'-N-acetyltransferase